MDSLKQNTEAESVMAVIGTAFMHIAIKLARRLLKLPTRDLCVHLAWLLHIQVPTYAFMCRYDVLVHVCVYICWEHSSSDLPHYTRVNTIDYNYHTLHTNPIVVVGISL